MFKIEYKPYSISDAGDILREAVKNGIHKNNQRISFYNIVAAFDIETTSFTDDSDIQDTSIYRAIISYKIRVPETKHYKELMKSYRSILTYRLNKGTSIEYCYEDLRQEFGVDLFPELDNPEDMLDHILRIYEMYKPRPVMNDKRSIMYVWQLAIDGRVIMGRTWDEFIELMDYITEELATSKYQRLLIYVHNLAFEFQYIRKLFEWEKVFAIDKRKPIYALTTSGIEFRCSYILTNYSLEKLGDQLHKYHIRKLAGYLDYSKPRHQCTPLTEQEIQYCVNDVLVVSAYIKEQIEAEKYIYKIPLTCTGYCRRYVRKNCLYNSDKHSWKKQAQQYHALMKSLTISDADEIEQLMRAFQGGFTHAASEYSTFTMTDVSSIDFTSSYPAVMLSEQFPMSIGKKFKPKNIEEFRHLLDSYCCLFDVRFYGLQQIYPYESYIPTYKGFLKEGVVDNNGRLYSAQVFCMTCTDIDFKLIEKLYKYERIDISNMRIYERGYLPIEIINSIIKLYKDKTTLKGVADKEVEYMVSKGLLNSCFGMIVTNIIRDVITYDTDWTVKSDDPDEQLERYNKSRKRFLFYPWGVWVTAYARRNLWTGILEFGEDYIYSDTDSIKGLNIKEHQEYIERYNANIELKLKTMCDYYCINYEEELLPRTIKGEVKPLGVWDFEGTYQKFKTIGAKRYITLKDGELSITVSGINKHTAVPYLIDKYGIDGAFEAFDDTLHIPADANGKLTHYYIDDEYEGYITDYTGITARYKAPSGIYLEKTGYDFDIKEDYIKFLKGVFITK